jgi:uncharacterized Zn finger protein
MMTNAETNGWRGKTIYRKCKCGETAFGAVWVTEAGKFVYKCRNCGAVRK